MARKPADSPVTVSVFDRLIDQEPKIRAEAPPTRLQSMRELKTALRRDLEWLLNTRQPLDPPPQGASELPRSLYNYGLPDITSMGLSTTADRTKLARIMETVLANFEPRLANAKVKFVQSGEGKTHMLRFVIEGLLRVDPAPEYVTFDTVLELVTGAYDVKGDAGAR
ncbi:MAG TPA: type VI secretion system baseplate subunit TssE [Bryobacteraceae bacterium]|jgi:type VI secretion system protein ImpF